MRRTISILLAALICTVLASCSHEEAGPSAKSQDGSRSEAVVQKQLGDAPAQPSATAVSEQKTASASPAQQNENWTILNRSDLSNQFEKDFLEGVWEPSESDVSRAIQGVRPCLEKLEKTTLPKRDRERIEDILAESDGYYACQAYGQTKDGKKLIHLSFFPKSFIRSSKEIEGSDWRHDLQTAVDGGTAFWRIDYDRQTNAYSGFDTNLDAGETYDSVDSGVDPGVGGNLW